MAVLDVKELSMYYADRCLFENVDFQIFEGSKVALVGNNGSGKTTLFNIIAGKEEAKDGKIILSGGARVAYLDQKNSNINLQNTLIDELNLSDFKKGKEEHEKNKSVDLIIKGLGFQDDEKNKKCGEFSPGFQMRISLAKVLLSESDFMLLDEPTNYLDIETRQFLASFLNSINNGFIIVSHDKFFLDTICKEVWELSANGFYKYKGNYSFYEKEKTNQMNLLLKEKERIDREKAEILEFAQRFRYQATKAKQVQERLKRLEKLKDVEVFENRQNVHFNFGQSLFSPNDVLTITGLSKSYGSKKVIDNLDLYVKKGEKLAVIGQNGRGKSTLLNLITGKIPKDAGQIKMHSSIVMKYFSQNTESTLNPANTIIDEIREVSTAQDEPRLKNMLAAFGFQENDILKEIRVLSGGEKSRVALLKLLLHKSNLLILDEATNHLDIPTKEVLLRALDDYNGSIIFVSHDIDFIRTLATNILYFGKNGHKYYNGDYDYFLYRRGIEDDKQVQVKEDIKSTFQKSNSEEKTIKNDFEVSKSQRNYITSLKRRVNDLEGLISKQELDIKDLEDKLNLPEVYSNANESLKITSALDNAKLNLNKLEEEWYEKSNELSLML